MHLRSSTVIAILTCSTLLCGCDKPAAPAASKPSGADSGRVPAGAGEEVVVTDANFKTEVLDSKQPVLVDIWASWCGPCMRAGPTIKALAAEYAGKAKVCKLDNDANPNTAKQYVKEGIPLFLVFKDGKLVHQSVGFANDQHLRAQLKTALDAALK